MASTNEYQDKFNEYVNHIQNYMYTFEVTKCCGYSTFVMLYKDETLFDLYKKIVLHFGGIQIKELFCITEDGRKMNIPMAFKTLHEFVRENVRVTPRNMVPKYSVPNPIVYKIMVDDGDCHDHSYN